MTPVYKLSANSVKNGRTVYGSMLAGNTAYVYPTDFESIATVTVGSGGASTIEFTSIPSTYTHLQIRFIARRNINSGVQYVSSRFNSDSASNYSYHWINGNGSSASANNQATDSRIDFVSCVGGPTSMFGAGILDILDYKNTNKYKTARFFAGTEINDTAGEVTFESALWRSTSAITAISFQVRGGTESFVQYTHFALYGIKAA